MGWGAPTREAKAQQSLTSIGKPGAPSDPDGGRGAERASERSPSPRVTYEKQDGILATITPEEWVGPLSARSFGSRP